MKGYVTVSHTQLIIRNKQWVWRGNQWVACREEHCVAQLGFVLLDLHLSLSHYLTSKGSATPNWAPPTVSIQMVCACLTNGSIDLSASGNFIRAMINLTLA